LHALQNPRVNIAGIRRSNLLPDLGMVSPTRLSRQLRRLLDLGGLTAIIHHRLTRTPARPRRHTGRPPGKRPGRGVWNTPPA
jgi:hypothetical protein